MLEAVAQWVVHLSSCRAVLPALLPAGVTPCGPLFVAPCTARAAGGTAGTQSRPAIGPTQTSYYAVQVPLLTLQGRRQSSGVYCMGHTAIRSDSLEKITCSCTPASHAAFVAVHAAFF
jgi:hypothetical protein